jgi:hypothetical protein
MKKLFTHPGLDHPVMLPCVKIVCPSCNGEGTSSRSDIDESKLADMALDEGDHDEYDAILRGRYHTVCKRCKGHNVVDDFDLSSLSKAQMRAIEFYEQCKREDDAYERAERRALGQ